MPEVTCRIDIYHPMGEPPLPAVKVEVLHDDGDIIVLNKPPCMQCMQGTYHITGYPTVAQTVKAFWGPEFSTNKRIDGTTSGIYLAGRMKTPGRGLSLLAELWTTPAVTKTYMAVIDGCPPWSDGQVTIPITNPSGTTAECTTGLTYIGEGAVLATLDHGGRYHQVRQALKSVGTPIVGDKKYGGIPGPRPLLHAYQIDIEGVGTFRAQTPEDMPEVAGATEPDWIYEVEPITEEHLAERHSKMLLDRCAGPLPTWEPGRTWPDVYHWRNQASRFGAHHPAG